MGGPLQTRSVPLVRCTGMLAFQRRGRSDAPMPFSHATLLEHPGGSLPPSDLSDKSHFLVGSIFLVPKAI